MRYVEMNDDVIYAINDATDGMGDADIIVCFAFDDFSALDEYEDEPYEDRYYDDIANYDMEVYDDPYTWSRR